MKNLDLPDIGDDLPEPENHSLRNDIPEADEVFHFDDIDEGGQGSQNVHDDQVSQSGNSGDGDKNDHSVHSYQDGHSGKNDDSEHFGENDHYGQRDDSGESDDSGNLGDNEHYGQRDEGGDGGEVFHFEEVDELDLEEPLDSGFIDGEEAGEREEEPEEEGKQEEKEKAEKPRRKREKVDAAKFLAVPVKLATKTAGFVINVLHGVTGFLSGLPLIGVIFRPLNKATSYLKKAKPLISTLVGLAVLALFILSMLNLFIPKSKTVNLPDDAKVKVEVEKMMDKKARVTIQNKSEIDVTVLPIVKEHSIFDSVRPWFTVTGECVADKEVTVPVGQVRRVELPCETPGKGLNIYTGEAL